MKSTARNKLVELFKPEDNLYEDYLNKMKNSEYSYSNFSYDKNEIIEVYEFRLKYLDLNDDRFGVFSILINNLKKHCDEKIAVHKFERNEIDNFVVITDRSMSRLIGLLP